MKAFAGLYETLDGTTSVNGKVSALVDYLAAASAGDAAWALFFLTGRRFKRFITSRQLTNWFLETQHIPAWLFAESYEAVGDTAETISLLLDSTVTDEADRITEHTKDKPEVSLAEWVENRILPLRNKNETEQRETLALWWKSLSRTEVYMLNKLLSGAFRVGVSQTLVVRALSQATGLPEAMISHRMMGDWPPGAAFFQNLICNENDDGGPIGDYSHPYPFYLAYPLEQAPGNLGDMDNWQVEWKWDGIRAQLIKRNASIFLWSRGEELITARFPEIVQAAATLPDGTVLDGEILAYDKESQRPLPFASLQTRIGRKTLSRKVLKTAPTIFMAYDLLEHDGIDVRSMPLTERRQSLEALVSRMSGDLNNVLLLSPLLAGVASWQDLAHLHLESRERGVEGFMLKRKTSTYQNGRQKGDWWKWKVDPYTIDAVLIYAQAGTGKRGNLYTDYTFALWKEDQLVPIAKAYSGLSNVEIEKLDRWIRSHTIEKFGPVRSVEAYHVFELAFEGIAPSPRHKSGVALRFPRIMRWRHDKTLSEADTLERLQALLK
jgi:DNA ligase-1